MTILARFRAKVLAPQTPDGCWLWSASTTVWGYGQLWDPDVGRAVGAHTISWRLHCGPIPEGMFVCHHCDVPACVNPEHLFLGTPADNIRDAAAKGRMRPGRTGARNPRRGANHPAAKLTAEQVRDIVARVRAGETRTEAGRRYGVTCQTVSRILKGIGYRDLEVV